MDHECKAAARRALLAVIPAGLPGAIGGRPGQRQNIIVERARHRCFRRGTCQPETRKKKEKDYFAGGKDCANRLGGDLECDSGHIGATIFQLGLLRFISQRASLPNRQSTCPCSYWMSLARQ
jgi:hypothetical protein